MDNTLLRATFYLSSLSCLFYLNHTAAAESTPYTPSWRVTELAGVKPFQKPENRQPFTYQENLHGIIEGIGEVPGQINILFTGTVTLDFSGNQLGTYAADAQRVRLQIPVRHFLVVIKNEDMVSTPFWPTGEAGWQRTLLQLQELAQNKTEVSLSLHLPSPLLSDTGDLLLLKCQGIALIVKPPYNMPQAGDSGR